jgi:hypothetical protein
MFQAVFPFIHNLYVKLTVAYRMACDVHNPAFTTSGICLSQKRFDAGVGVIIRVSCKFCGLQPFEDTILGVLLVSSHERDQPVIISEILAHFFTSRLRIFTKFPLTFLPSNDVTCIPIVVLCFSPHRPPSFHQQSPFSTTQRHFKVQDKTGNLK